MAKQTDSEAARTQRDTLNSNWAEKTTAHKSLHMETERAFNAIDN